MAKKSNTATVARKNYDETKKLVIVDKKWTPRKGARTQKIFAALRASKTVGQFKAARAKMGLSGVGKLFVQLIDAKVLKLA